MCGFVCRCYIAERTKNMSKIWKDVFADDLNRVVVVIQGQAGEQPSRDFQGNEIAQGLGLPGHTSCVLGKVGGMCCDRTATAVLTTGCNAVQVGLWHQRRSSPAGKQDSRLLWELSLPTADIAVRTHTERGRLLQMCWSEDGVCVTGPWLLDIVVKDPSVVSRRL